MSMAVDAAGIRTPRLRSARQVDQDTALLAYDHLDAPSLADLPDRAWTPALHGGVGPVAAPAQPPTRAPRADHRSPSPGPLRLPVAHRRRLRRDHRRGRAVPPRRCRAARLPRAAGRAGARHRGGRGRARPGHGRLAAAADAADPVLRGHDQSPASPSCRRRPCGHRRRHPRPHRRPAPRGRRPAGEPGAGAAAHRAEHRRRRDRLLPAGDAAHRLPGAQARHVAVMGLGARRRRRLRPHLRRRRVQPPGLCEGARPGRQDGHRAGRRCLRRPGRAGRGRRPGGQHALPAARRHPGVARGDGRRRLAGHRLRLLRGPVAAVQRLRRQPPEGDRAACRRSPPRRR